MKTTRILATITALIAAAALTFSSCDEFNFSFINNGNETPEKDNTGDTTTETPDPDHFWDPVVIDTDGLTKISFTESTDDFANPETGFYTSDLSVSNLERESVKIADHVAVVTQSAKFGMKALVKFADFSDIDLLVTDDGLPPAVAARLAQHGLEVVLAANH